MQISNPLCTLPLEQAPQPIEGQSVYVYVDRKSLGGKKSKLNEMIMELMTTCRVNSKTHGTSTLKLLLSLAYITHNSWLGDEAVTDMNKLPENLNRLAFIDNACENVSRVSMYYTEMLTVDGVIDGWMFEFAKNTPSFNFSKALKNLMVYNKKLKAPKMGWKGWESLVHTSYDMTKFISEVIIPNIVNTITLERDEKISLDLKTNQLEENLMYSFEYISAHEYMGEGYYKALTKGLTSKGKKYVSFASTAPHILFNSELPYEYAESHKDWEKGLSTEAKKTIRFTPRPGGSEGVHVLRYTIDICKQDIEKGADVRSSIFEQRLQSVLSTEQDPGIHAIFNWMVSNDAFMNDPYTEKTVSFDKRFTPMQNDIVARMIIYEEVFGSLAFHQEMLLLDLNRHGVQTYSDNMYLHLIMCGGAGAGKSYLLKFLQNTSIPGTVISVSYASKQADNVEENRNFLMIVNDELHEKFFEDADSGGNAQLKEKISNNRVVSLINQQNEVTEKREAKRLECECHNVYIGATNRMWSDIPGPIADRFAGLTMPIYDRPGVKISDTCQRSNTDKLITKFKEMIRREQALCAYLFKMIDIGIIPRADLKVANRYFKQVFEYITEHGLEVEIRNHARCLLLAETITVWNAIRRVFFSGKPVSDRPLTSKCFFECIPYLVCDEDIAILVLTMLREMFVNPNVNRVCKSIYDIAHLREKISFSSERDPTNLEIKPDFTYYFIKHQSASMFQNDRIDDLAKNIYAHKSKDTFAKISKANIKDALLFIEKKSKYSKIYTSESTFIAGRTELLPILKYVQLGQITGFAILRDFVDEMKSAEKDLVFDAIQNCVDKFTKERVVLTAVSYRDGAPKSDTYQDIMYPQFLKTLEIKPNPNIESIAKNYEYVPLEFQMAINNVSEPKPETEQKPYLILDENYYDICYRDHCKKHVRFEVDQSLLRNDETKETTLSYPFDYIKAHSDSFIVDKTELKHGDEVKVVKRFIQDISRKPKGEQEEVKRMKT